MSGCHAGKARCGVRRGQVCKIACRAPRCSRSMRAWPVPNLKAGRILPLSRSGAPFSAYVVAKHDLAVFTLGRLPDESGPLKRAQDIAARLQVALAGRRMTYGAPA